MLREKMGRANLTHQEVADAIGISRPQVSKILAGAKQIDLEQLDELCWALGLSFRDVVVAADEKTEMRHTGPDWETPTLTRQ
jgi:DNA-binding Xre family transcriptional regulator